MKFYSVCIIVAATKRPDGLNFHFYKKAWHIMKEDLMAVFSSFFSTGKLPKGLNSSFLVLVPKVPGTSSITDFRPISLINGVYKLLSKVLSFQLRAVLPTVISETQQAFLKERNILDCSMIAFEVINIISRRRERAVILKLDFQKAFDCLLGLFSESDDQDGV